MLTAPLDPAAPAQAPTTPLQRPAAAPRPAVGSADEAQHARRIAQRLALVEASVALQRRIVHAGEAVYVAGQRFTHLHVAHAGVYKVVNLTRDGREQIVSLKFRGDWLGLDGIAEGAHDCDAVAMDTGEVWSIAYPALMQACAQRPALMAALHEEMSRELARDRNSLMSVCTLSADARVADFLHGWATALRQRGLRTDQITLRMTRAEIGSYLGLTLETVSRALSRLARESLIRFPDPGRRELQIPDARALGDFALRGCAAAQRLE